MGPVTPFLTLMADKVPSDNSVVAGWGGFAVFVGLCLAVAVLGISLARHLRKARQNFGVEEVGSFKDSPKRLDQERTPDA
ncbi:hypothetical protein D9V37_01945 [Nocardioides mangrovicus]|uniref:Uncharacterized protein n=2 Tax=Nocardioides mangrovicus TaxID=2478913 RepID=A0A3L8P5Q7_9ACTN|nr:hypothetical protein D9V37_01945 [Nocardioides mangrovicus]